MLIDCDWWSGESQWVVCSVWRVKQVQCCLYSGAEPTRVQKVGEKSADRL